MQQFKFSALLFFCLLAFAQNAQAQATLSIQGVLQKFNGSAVDDGQYDITFRLYTTDAGGTALWSETQTVTVTGGVYSVLLGAVNALTVPFDQPYYVGLTIPGGPEHTPRTQLTAAPYALSMLGQDNKFPSTGMVKMDAVATGTETTTATSYTVADNDHVIYLDHTANQNVTLPAATAANTGRNLMLVNKEAVAKTLTSSNYVDVTTGTTSTTIPANSVIELQSDGSVWRQTGGYVKPAAQAKAYVRLGRTADVSMPGNTQTTVPFTELSDAQNCWNTSTHTFTAPRTGIYRLSGAISFYTTNNVSCSLLNSNEANMLGALTVGVVTGTYTLPFSTDYPMTAGQTFKLLFTPAGPAVTVHYSGGGGVFYPGYMTILEQ